MAVALEENQRGELYVSHLRPMWSCNQNTLAEHAFYSSTQCWHTEWSNGCIIQFVTISHSFFFIPKCDADAVSCLITLLIEFQVLGYLRWFDLHGLIKSSQQAAGLWGNMVGLVNIIIVLLSINYGIVAVLRNQLARTCNKYLTVQVQVL